MEQTSSINDLEAIKIDGILDRSATFKKGLTALSVYRARVTFNCTFVLIDIYVMDMAEFRQVILTP